MSADERRLLRHQRGNEIRIELVLRRVLLDEIPVLERKDRRQDLSRQLVAAVSHELRIRPLHQRNRAARQGELARPRLGCRHLFVGPRDRRGDAGRISPLRARELQLFHRGLVQSGRKQRADGAFGRRKVRRLRLRAARRMAQTRGGSARARLPAFAACVSARRP